MDRSLLEVVPLFGTMRDRYVTSLCCYFVYTVAIVRSVMELLLGNYLEHVVHVCLGVDKVYCFFQACQVTGME